MTEGQDPSYTPAPVSQRDGSSLANSNCRMASIATGLDYHTRGAKKSTGAKMRTYTSDQSGGTDSGDAVQAWKNGYGQTLTVRDGYTFDNAISDLRKGSAVHLDVWHASVGGQVCVSGSGAYGHTMFVLPDEHSDGARWKVCDPWCSPAKWVWVDESKLRAGAEEWGRRVYGTAVLEADYPTEGRGTIGDPRDELALFVVRRIVRELLELANPAEPSLPWDVETPTDWGDTGGGKPVLFTRTAAIPLDVPEVPDVPGLRISMLESVDGSLTMVGTGHSWIRVHDAVVSAPVAEGWGPKHVFGRAKLVEPLETPAGTLVKGTGVLLIGDELAVVPEHWADLQVFDEPVPPPVEGETPEEAYTRGRADEWVTWANGLGIPPEPGG